MSHLVRHNVRAMSAYVPGEQPTGSGIIKLNTNENPYPPSPAVRGLLASFAAESLRLYPDPQCRRLRARIATLHGCDPDQVMIGNGSDELLELCTRAFVENNQALGYLDPSYSLYPVLAKIRSVPDLVIPLNDDFTWPGPIAGLAERNCALFFITNPNAPSGVLYPLEALGEFSAAFRGVVVIDEAYVDFARRDCMGLALTMENVIVTRTLSKSYSLAGLRCGYAVGPRLLISALATIRDAYNLGRLEQEIAEAAIGDQAHMRANVDRIVATRRRLAAALEARGFGVFPSDANFLWVRPRPPGAAPIFEALRARRIYVRYFAGPRTGEFLRITVGTDAEIDALLAALDGIPAAH